MNRPFATMLSTLRREWAAWRSMMYFLAHLHDVDFYRGFDEQREIDPARSRSFGVLGERSRPMEKEACFLSRDRGVPIFLSRQDYAKLRPAMRWRTQRQRCWLHPFMKYFAPGERIARAEMVSPEDFPRSQRHMFLDIGREER